MIMTHRLQSILLAAVVAAPTLAGPAESLAQDRTGQAGSPRSAIDEARRSPFYAGLRSTLPAAAHDESAQPPRELANRTFSPARGELAPKVLFYTLPVIVALDAYFVYGITKDDEGQYRRRGDFSAVRALSAILGPALVARLAGARLPVAIVGSTLGFSGVAMATMMLGRAAYLVGPVLHASATALLAALGTR